MKPLPAKAALLGVAAFFLSASLGAQAPTPPADAAYRNPALEAGLRADSLLSYMTLDEKIGQMAQAARDYILDQRDLAAYGLGSVLSGGGSGPPRNEAVAWADMYDSFQKAALKSRLSIPIIYGIDSVHGNNSLRGAVIFPHNIGMGAAGDPALMERAAAATALETAAVGIDWTFAPCVAVPQDPRWGRSYEGFSEDPALVASLGAAAVRGLQGPADLSELGSGRRVLACAKHFIADGGTLGGKDQGDARLDEKELRSLFLPPYRSAVEAGVGSVMVSFSSVNALKMHQNKKLITDLLKGELGFKGIVVSDWAGVKQLPGSSKDAIGLAINAGIDMVMVPDDYRGFILDLKALVAEGAVSQKRIDDAARRILTVKFRLGLFERPLADRSLLKEVGSADHRELARECVRESLVLLKNDGTLPIRQSVKRIAVLGNGADDIGLQCGGWTISWQGQAGAITKGSTVLQAVKEAAPKGCKVIAADTVKEIGKADLAIVVAAEMPYAEFEGDDPRLRFPGAANAQIIAELRKKGIPAVTVLLSGRPLDIRAALADSSAFVAAWLPGTEAGGIADMLFGASKPVGKLPFTWFESADDIPVHSRSAAKGVLFPLGYGLTY
jgi:beta-glucosidase